MNNEEKILSMLESLTTSVSQVREAQEETTIRIDKLEETTNKRFDKMEAGLVETNNRINKLEETTNKRFDKMEEATNMRFNRIETSLGETNARLDGLEADVRSIIHQQNKDSRILKGFSEQVAVLTEYQTLAETKFEKIMTSQ